MLSSQLRAARALLGWSQDELAAKSGVSKPTIARLELSEGEIGGYASTREKMEAALRKAGVIFVAGNGDGPGVRLRKTPENAAELTRRIDVIEGDLTKPDRSSEQTPAGGMEKLERAHKRETIKKLKNRRTKLQKRRSN